MSEGERLTHRSGGYRGDHGPVTFTSYALGAQVTSVALGDDQLFFLSDLATYRPGAAIRGGVPVCFPWFADGPDGDLEPSHGFVRKVEWELIGDRGDETGHELLWRIGSEQVAAADGREEWPADFEAICRHAFGEDGVLIELTVRNRGAEPITFEELLHSYLRVDDLDALRVTGLAGARYLDKTRDLAEFTQEGDVSFTGPTDRIYASDASLTLHDGDRTIIVDKINSANTVVWNPFDAGVAKFADLGPDDWRRFVCIEAGNVRENAITVDPGAEHTFGTRIRRAP